MPAITDAVAEIDVFQPENERVTGGFKRGAATAAAGIHDICVASISD